MTEALADEPAVPATGSETIVDICDLSIAFGDAEPTVNGVSFTVRAGETAALIGESGSGKTLLAKSLLGLLPKGAHIVRGDVQLLNQRVSSLSSNEHRQLRGRQLGIVLQEPLTSLNPALTVGSQLIEAQELHLGISREQAFESARAMLIRVGVDEAESRLRQHPHEFSGGMRQRIMIAAMALLRPRLLIADEPTTAVDAVLQRSVMTLLAEITTEIDASLLLVSHDLGVVLEAADTVHVMQRGRLVESGSAERTLGRPRHAYTRQLLESLPRKRSPVSVAMDRSSSKQYLCATGLAVSFPGRRLLPWRKPAPVPALRPTDIHVGPGEVLSVVGESGSGKTTLGRALTGLTPVSEGQIRLEGREIGSDRANRKNELVSQLQFVFQDPFSSLNPRWTVADIIAEPLIHMGVNPSTTESRVVLAMKDCGLEARYASRFPHELSGGQRQRVGIARALVVEPSIVVADEPVSALDLTVQAQILALMGRLQRDRGFSLIFISHDLAVVESLTDRVAVMREGRIVEEGTGSDVFDHASHPYTQSLLDASPVLGEHSDGEFSLEARRYTPRAIPQDFQPAVLNRHAAGTGLRYLPLTETHRVLVGKATASSRGDRTTASGFSSRMPLSSD